MSSYDLVTKLGNEEVQVLYQVHSLTVFVSLSTGIVVEDPHQLLIQWADIYTTQLSALCYALSQLQQHVYQLQWKQSYSNMYSIPTSVIS